VVPKYGSANYYFWLNAKKESGIFKWLGSHKELSFTNWAPSHPFTDDNYDGIYIYVTSSGQDNDFKWFSYFRDHKAHFICQIDLN